MKNTRIWLAVITAAVTFSAWMLVAGPDKFAKFGRQCQGKQCVEQGFSTPGGKP